MFRHLAPLTTPKHLQRCANGEVGHLLIPGQRHDECPYGSNLYYKWGIGSIHSLRLFQDIRGIIFAPCWRCRSVVILMLTRSKNFRSQTPKFIWQSPHGPSGGPPGDLRGHSPSGAPLSPLFTGPNPPFNDTPSAGHLKQGLPLRKTFAPV